MSGNDVANGMSATPAATHKQWLSSLQDHGLYWYLRLGPECQELLLTFTGSAQSDIVLRASVGLGVCMASCMACKYVADAHIVLRDPQHQVCT